MAFKLLKKKKKNCIEYDKETFASQQLATNAGFLNFFIFFVGGGETIKFKYFISGTQNNENNKSALQNQLAFILNNQRQWINVMLKRYQKKKTFHFKYLIPVSSLFN